MTTSQKYRVQLDFSAKDFAEIERLVEKLDLPTRAELFRSALVTLRWMVQKKENECTILAVDPKGRLLEPEFEFFQNFNPPSGEAQMVHDRILEHLDPQEAANQVRRQTTAEALKPSKQLATAEALG